EHDQSERARDDPGEREDPIACGGGCDGRSEAGRGGHAHGGNVPAAHSFSNRCDDCDTSSSDDVRVIEEGPPPATERPWSNALAGGGMMRRFHVGLRVLGLLLPLATGVAFAQPPPPPPPPLTPLPAPPQPAGNPVTTAK